MSNANAARAIDQREDSLNATLDRAILRLENELDGLENIANALDGQSPPKAGRTPENKPSTPGHTLWKAKHLDDLMGRLAELSQRINSNIGG